MTDRNIVNVDTNANVNFKFKVKYTPMDPDLNLKKVKYTDEENEKFIIVHHTSLPVFLRNNKDITTKELKEITSKISDFISLHNSARIIYNNFEKSREKKFLILTQFLTFYAIYNISVFQSLEINIYKRLAPLILGSGYILYRDIKSRNGTRDTILEIENKQSDFDELNGYLKQFNIELIFEHNGDLDFYVRLRN